MGDHTAHLLGGAEGRGVLVRRPMFIRIEPDGVRMSDGPFNPPR